MLYRHSSVWDTSHKQPEDSKKRMYVSCMSEMIQILGTDDEMLM